MATLFGTGPHVARALQGITILEMSRLLPGALATQMLSDLGAKVIKVEQPGIGDYQRDLPPKNVRDSASFLLCNRNKRSITLNLKQPDGLEAARRLATRADVLIEGFRPGVMTRLGLGYDAVAALNPRLVYCSLTGFGQDGPYRDLPGHDMNYLGIVGAMQLLSRAATGPLVPGPLIADIGGGSLMAVFGILAALIGRGVTGRGQHVDVSMTDGMMAWMAPHAGEWLFAGKEPRGGEYFNAGGAASYDVYRCADDRFITLGIIERHFWDRLKSLLEAPDLPDDPLAAGAAAESARAKLAGIFVTRPAAAWIDLLQAHDIPCGPVNGFAEAFADKQMQSRQMLQWMEHKVEGRIPQIGFPVKFSDTPGEMRLPPPGLGEHTDDILAELGYAAQDISQMRAQGAI
jgi:crotonobetainyl-CoA:carnitine CoA-transferase CaiB-like acyl-CoA transferase